MPPLTRTLGLFLSGALIAFLFCAAPGCGSIGQQKAMRRNAPISPNDPMRMTKMVQRTAAQPRGVTHR
jgi:hypothetical protein